MTPMKRILMLGLMIEALCAEGQDIGVKPKTSAPVTAKGKTTKRAKVKAARKHHRKGKTP